MPGTPRICSWKTSSPSLPCRSRSTGCARLQSGPPSRRGSSFDAPAADGLVHRPDQRSCRAHGAAAPRNAATGRLHLGGARRPRRRRPVRRLAVLFVYDDDDHWAKFAVEITAAGPIDRLGRHRHVLRRLQLDGARAEQRPAATGRSRHRRGDRLSHIRRRRPLGARPGLPTDERGAAHRLRLPGARTGAGCTVTFDAITFTARSLSDIRDSS